MKSRLRLRLVYYDLEAMEKEVKELVAQTRESVSTIESRLEEKAEDLLSEAGEEKKRLEAEAVQIEKKPRVTCKRNDYEFRMSS